MTTSSDDLLAGFAAGFTAAGDRLGVIDYEFEAAGCGVRLRVAGDRLHHDLTAAFEHLPKPDRGQTVAAINCWVADEALDPAQAPSLMQMPASVAPRSEPEDRYEFVAGFEGCLDALDRSNATVWRRLARRQLPWWEIAAPLRTPLFWLLGAQGRFLTHGAAVGRDGQAALIVGPGGSGKSTTALTCLLAGLDYLGDDYTVTSTQDGPQVHSLYGSAKLNPKGVEGMEPLLRDAADFTGSHGEKLVVWPSRTFPDRMIASAEICTLLVPTITGRPGTALAPIGKAAALRALAPSSILQFPTGGDAALASLARLVEAVPCQALLLGTDRGRIPDVVSAAIGGGSA